MAESVSLDRSVLESLSIHVAGDLAYGNDYRINSVPSISTHTMTSPVSGLVDINRLRSGTCAITSVCLSSLANLPYQWQQIREEYGDISSTSQLRFLG